MTMADDFADLILDWHNEEGRDLTSESLVVITGTCSFFERDSIVEALPQWAQRRIEATSEAVR